MWDPKSSFGSFVSGACGGLIIFALQEWLKTWISRSREKRRLKRLFSVFLDALKKGNKIETILTMKEINNSFKKIGFLYYESREYNYNSDQNQNAPKDKELVSIRNQRFYFSYWESFDPQFNFRKYFLKANDIMIPGNSLKDSEGTNPFFDLTSFIETLNRQLFDNGFTRKSKRMLIRDRFVSWISSIRKEKNI